MQFLAVAALLFTAAFAAPSTEAPAGLARRNEAWCPRGLYSVPQCCDADVIGVADLDCVVPPFAPSRCKSFYGACASIGRQPKCCVLPVAGVAVLCTDALPPAF
ncbi:fungal hydrophobin domain-containing protein [Trichoderma breve]|uniref:Fungal hydrophobin domain-containing protein n=1 Tax=Trichoderma breve TaxID=2034170 RepID=A0A9W9BC98_9HYPO|nr:fungal hydrophobin domain-containing protein [Trichoderma breve]KAJ4856931.1 fungal hydrophobin domain-containing protein [Trichoderma breve]